MEEGILSDRTRLPQSASQNPQDEKIGGMEDSYRPVP